VVKWSKELIDNAIVYYVENDVNVREVADKFNIGYTALMYHVRNRGLTKRGNSGGRVVEEAIHAFTTGSQSCGAVAREFGIDADRLRYFLVRAGVMDSSRSRLSYGRHYFDSIDTEDKAYWLGFIYADGNIRSKRYGHDKDVLDLTISKSDIEHLIKFKECIGYEGEIKHVQDKRGHKSVRISLSSSELVSSLLDKGLIPKKSMVIQYPKWIAGNEFERHFVRGYVDGNGSLYTYLANGKPKFCVNFCGSLDVVDSIGDFISRNLGLNLTVYKHTSTTELYFMTTAYKKAFVICELLYENCTLYLDRKMSLYKEIRPLYK